MKHSLLFLVAFFPPFAAYAQSPPGNTRSQDLRLVLQQRPMSSAEGLRRLSPQERAELRRQIVQFSKTAANSS